MTLLTAAEYKSAPTAVDLSALVIDGNQAEQDAELGRVIARAAGWAENTVCNQRLGASQRTELHTTRYGKGGRLSINPDCSALPLVSLDRLFLGTNAADLLERTDLSAVWAERGSWKIPDATGLAGSTVTLGFPWNTSGDLAGTVLAKIVYTAGWPATTLAAACTATATTIVVASSAGVVAGGKLTIPDGESTERVTVTSVSGSTVHLSAPLLFAHAAGVACHDLPEDVKQAMILAVSGFLRSRGADSIQLGQSLAPGSGPAPADDAVRSADLRLARAMLASYRRVL